MAAIPNCTSSGHLRRCSIADTHIKSLFMANYNEPLQAVDCDIHSVRYKMALERKLAAISDASSDHIRHFSMADTHRKSLSRAKDASILSWPTIMSHYKLWIATFMA